MSRKLGVDAGADVECEGREYGWVGMVDIPSIVEDTRIEREGLERGGALEWPADAIEDERGECCRAEVPVRLERRQGSAVQRVRAGQVQVGEHDPGRETGLPEQPKGVRRRGGGVGQALQRGGAPAHDPISYLGHDLRERFFNPPRPSYVGAGGQAESFDHLPQCRPSCALQRL